MKYSRIAVIAAALSVVWGQTPTPPRFEAASIKLNKTLSGGSGLNLQPARIKIINSSLKFCIQMAWHVQPFQISGGPGWTDSDRYDIEAVAAAPFKPDEYRTMLQALLVERFGLTVHRETQEKPGYALVVARGGPKLPPPIDDASVFFSRTPSGEVALAATSASMATLAEVLSSRLGMNIVDRTGIEGNFNVSLQYTPDSSNLPMGRSGLPEPPPAADATAGPSIYTALQEKLGLKLEPGKMPVQVVIIDRAERPSDN